MSTDWINAKDDLPAPAKRVLVLTEKGNWLPGKMVRCSWDSARKGWSWIDDESRVIFNVVAWAEVVAPGETL